LILPAHSDTQIAKDGDFQALVEFDLSNDVPPVLPEDIIPSFTRYDGVSAASFNFSKDRVTFNVSPVQLCEDEGNYSVVVRNPAGSSTATVYLDVQSRSADVCIT
jgi:hypothetical protein